MVADSKDQMDSTKQYLTGYIGAGMSTQNSLCYSSDVCSYSALVVSDLRTEEDGR